MRDNRTVFEKVLRVASTFSEVEAMDREDLARLTFEERISAVETLRRVWFGEDRPESRLERVLVVADLHERPLRARRGTPLAGTGAELGNERIHELRHLTRRRRSIYLGTDS
ncbi:MAG: hypothetical protein WCI05_11895 [Myxococcales bacterium]